MSPERWKHVQRLFHEAAERPAAERPAFLEAACGADAALRAEVEALLAADAAPPSVLDAAAGRLAAFAAGAPPPAAAPEAGRRLGPYRLLSEIGQGGMGTVYLAERDDGQFRKAVAVKLVRRGLEDPQALRRFRHERQILAALEHPNIARLLDGGVSDDGRPYLVMEHVEGEPLDRYCDARRLPVEARLALFTAVCEAVRYAHRNLVVHRDLKPGNILVTGDGTVKLLDFGIAKLLEADDDADDVPLTRTGLRPMTPEYAAPEQIRGEAVTTATDVYALGVVLYELLTGRRPYTAATTSLYETERAVLEQAPERPSTAVLKAGDRADDRGASPKALHRRLRGDLDTLLLTALRKEPERRYPSADALADDIRRHLEGRPLTARGDTFGYRLATFARRHRWAVAAAALVLLSLVGGLSAALWQARRAAAERDVAVQVSAFLESLLSAADPDLPDAERLDTLRLRDMLDRSARKVRQELAEQPQVQARMLYILGQAYVNLGLFEPGQPLLDEAVALRRRLDGADDPATSEAELALAEVHLSRGRYDEAERLFRHVLAAYRRRDAPEAAYPLASLAVTLQARGAFDEAEQAFREALDALRAGGAEMRFEYGEAANDFAIFYHQIGNYPAAESLAHEAVRVHTEMLGPRNLNVALALNTLALVKTTSGRPDEAEPLYAEAISILRETYGGRHPYLSVMLQNLANTYDNEGAYERADSLYREAIAADHALLGPGHPETALKMRNHALSRYMAGDYDAAERLLREATALLDTTVADDHFYRIATRMTLGKVLTVKGSLAEGERLLRASLAQFVGLLEPDHYLVASARRDLGACLARQRRFAEAEPLLVESYAALRAGPGDDSYMTREAVQRLAELYEAWGRPAEAARYRALLPAAPAP